MPVEIKELVIRATTLPETADSGRPEGQANLDAEREAIIEECVRQVLKVLQRKKER